MTGFNPNILTPGSQRWHTVIALLCICLFASFTAAAQKDTSDKIRVYIENARAIVHVETDSGKFTKFLNDVILRQGTDTLYCDSAYENEGTKNFEAFSNVRIAQQGGTKGNCDYLKYTSKQKLAYMHGNVSLTDGKNNLECEDLTYDLGTKVATYDNWGKLHADSTVVTSKTGVYNVSDKNARFTGTVYIVDPQYKIYSEDLLYNTESKTTEFFSKSTVVRDNGQGILQTTSGTYDGKNGVAHFIHHSSIWNEGQYIEADTLDYSKITGHGLAVGNVISLDTEHHSIMYCGFAEYWQKQRRTLATIKPVLVQVNGKDTFYMRADTFYSAPMVRSNIKGTGKVMPPDTIANPQPPDTTAYSGGGTPIKKLKPKKDTVNWVIGTGKKEIAKKGRKAAKEERKKRAGAILQPGAVADTAQADTTAPLYFIGYHHVLLFSDSMQGKCDSICYTRSDSLIRMMYDPIAWSHNSQITGDTILMQLDSSRLRRMFVPNNAFLVSQEGPDKAHMYNQIQGRTLVAYFVNNRISKMTVYPDVQCIYYPKDEKNFYMGLTNVTSTRMRVVFDDQTIESIIFLQDVHTKSTPMDQADIEGAKLSRFKWRIDQRPKSKEELFK